MMGLGLRGDGILPPGLGLRSEFCPSGDGKLSVNVKLKTCLSQTPKKEVRNVPGTCLRCRQGLPSQSQRSCRPGAQSGAWSRPRGQSSKRTRLDSQRTSLLRLTGSKRSSKTVTSPPKPRLMTNLSTSLKALNGGSGNWSYLQPLVDRWC